MPRLLHALCTGTGLVMPLTLAVGMLLGPARLAHSEDTSCTQVQALQAGTCMPYTYGTHTKDGPHTYVLCNGPFSLCTTANCTQKNPGDPAQCPCAVVPTGLSIRTALVDKGALSAISNFASAAGLEVKQCPQAPLVNCLNASCTMTGPTTSSCTCPVAAGGQIIL